MSGQDYEVLIAQMKKETEEYKADAERMSRALSSVNVGMENHDARFRKSLEGVCEALDILTPDAENLILGLSDLKNESEMAKNVLESIQKRTQKYKNDLPGILKQREWWQKVLDRLETQEGDKQGELTKMKKSTLFHSKKKQQYDNEIASNKRILSSAGYEESLSHESLVESGSEVKDMNERLEILRLQLNTYNDLPPSQSQGLVKLEEKRIQVQRLENELADKLGEVTMVNTRLLK